MLQVQWDESLVIMFTSDVSDRLITTLKHHGGIITNRISMATGSESHIELWHCKNTNNYFLILIIKDFASREIFKLKWEALLRTFGLEFHDEHHLVTRHDTLPMNVYLVSEDP